MLPDIDKPVYALTLQLPLEEPASKGGVKLVLKTSTQWLGCVSRGSRHDMFVSLQKVGHHELFSFTVTIRTVGLLVCAKGHTEGMLGTGPYNNNMTLKLLHFRLLFCGPVVQQSCYDHS